MAGIPYFWSDYNNGISNDYWNYGATTTTGPWSGAISVTGSTYITSNTLCCSIIISISDYNSVITTMSIYYVKI